MWCYLSVVRTPVGSTTLGQPATFWASPENSLSPIIAPHPKFPYFTPWFATHAKTRDFVRHLFQIYAGIRLSVKQVPA
jgi:hypothetical protein